MNDGEMRGPQTVLGLVQDSSLKTQLPVTSCVPGRRTEKEAGAPATHLEAPALPGWGDRPIQLIGYAANSGSCVREVYALGTQGRSYLTVVCACVVDGLGVHSRWPLGRILTHGNWAREDPR